MPPFLCNLLNGLIEDLGWRSRRIEERDIRAILRPLRTVDAPYRHYLVVGFRVCAACECWWRIEEKITSTVDAERSYVLPLKTRFRRRLRSQLDSSVWPAILLEPAARVS